jgi:Zn-dependent alcohol dehydrogenase
MKIQGAILERLGAERPYAQSHPLTVEDIELDGPGPGEILIRIEVAGVCHSDLSVVNGSRVRPVPMLLGHEAAGIVEAVGEGVDDLDIGGRVVLTFLPRCGECTECLKGGIAPCEQGSASNGAGTLLSGSTHLSRHGENIHHHLGVSGFATHAVVDRRSVVPVDADVPARVAALLGCAVLTGGGAVINAGKVQAGETLVIVGLGGVGMAALLTGLALDDVRVIAIDSSPEKLERALELGAHAAYLPEEAAHAGIHADVVVEAVGKARAFESALALTGPGGRLVTVGLPSADDLATVSPLSLVATGRTIIGSYLGTSIPSRDIPYFVQLWKSGRLPVEQLISKEITLDRINEAMDELANGTVVRQLIIFEPNAPALDSDLSANAE